MLESSTVIKRLLAIGMLGALAFLLSPEPTLGQSALKEKPPGYSHRFPPLPDKIQRLDAYRQRRERAGLLSKFVFWAAESGAQEVDGAMIIDMPSEGPAKGFFSSNPTIIRTNPVIVTDKATLTITPSEPDAEEAPKQVLREVPTKRPVDPNVKQASATKSNKNEFVHELVVPSATDPSLPPLPDQVKAAPPRKPKVPMLRRIPEFSTTSVDDAIQKVDNVEKTSPHDLPAVRGVEQAVAMEPLVEPRKANEPELRPIVVAPAAKTATTPQPNAVATPKPAKSTVPRKLPNIVEEKKKTTVSTKPKPLNKPVAKPTPKVAAKKPTTVQPPSAPPQRVIAAGERPTHKGTTNRHPSMVRSDIKQTGGTSAGRTAVAAAAPSKSISDAPGETDEPSPRNLPELESSKELPPLPTEAEVAETQRKFEEALLKASKRAPEPKQEGPADLTLPSEPLQEEPTAPAVQIAEETPTPSATEPESLESEESSVAPADPVAAAPTEIEATEEPTPAPALEFPVEETKVVETPAAPAPIVQTVPAPVAPASPMPVAHQPVPMPTPMEPAMSPPAMAMETPALVEQEATPHAVPKTMSREEALAGLEASTSPEPVAPSPVPVAVPTEPMPAMTGSPMPSMPMTKMPTTKPEMDPTLAEAQLELESIVHGVKVPNTSASTLKNAQDELEALVQGRPIPKTTAPVVPTATAEELLDAESELADLTRQKGQRPVPPKSIAPPALPSTMNRPTQVVPKATSSTAPKQAVKPGSNAKPLAAESKKNAPLSVTESKPKLNSTKPPSPTPSPPIVKGEPTKSASTAKSPSVVDSIKEKVPTLPDLPAPVEASSNQRPTDSIVMPTEMTEPSKAPPAVATDRPPLKTTDVTKLADEIKKSKKASPNPSLLANTAKGTKGSGTSSSTLTSSRYESKPTSKPETASENSKNDPPEVTLSTKKTDVEKNSLPPAPVKPQAETKVAESEKRATPPAVDSKNIVTKPLATETGTPVLSPLPSSSEVASSSDVNKEAPETTSPSLPTKIKPHDLPQMTSQKSSGGPAVDNGKSPKAPPSGGLTFGLQAIEQGLFDATKPSKELASNGNAPAPTKPATGGPARFNVAKLESFDDPTAKPASRPASLGRPKATPGLNPKDAIPLVPDDETVIEDPTAPTPFNDEHAAMMIKAIKGSANCQEPLRDLTHMEYWYRASGAVDAVTHVARHHSDVSLRIQATRLLGTVPLTMSEATNSLKALAKEATEPNVKETAEALLSERLASVPRSALR